VASAAAVARRVVGGAVCVAVDLEVAGPRLHATGVPASIVGLQGVQAPCGVPVSDTALRVVFAETNMSH
jgi:hypothetical protein